MSDHETAKTFTRGKLAQEAGCNLETIRYYEKIGMMPDPPRTVSGYRVYNESHARRLRFIMRARDLGFGLDEIRGLLHLVDGKSQTCAEVQHRTEHHLAEIRAKIADLQRIETDLVAMASQCSGDNVPECPIIESLLQ